MKPITRIVLLAATLLMPALSSAGTYVSITVAPPPLPVYAQPVCPGDGYIWTPGYWAWDGDEYYWVPGVWVLAPAVNVFWTPGYWGWAGGFYTWHAGYWGPHVGFYGGVNYGYGYTGNGYYGGRWEGGAFHYNRAVNNINIVNVHNTYNTVVVNHNSSRVSFNGGDHGTRARPTSREIAAARDNHMGPTSMQEQHVQTARADRSLRFSQNRGNPGNAFAPHSSQGHMPSSGFAPHGNNGQRNGPRAPQVNGAMNDRAATSHGGGMPSSSYAPRERPHNSGGMPQDMHREMPRAANPNVMNGPAPRQRMGGGEGRHNEGPRPQQEHRREPH